MTDAELIAKAMLAWCETALYLAQVPQDSSARRDLRIWDISDSVPAVTAELERREQQRTRCRSVWAPGVLQPPGKARAAGRCALQEGHAGEHAYPTAKES